MSSREERRSAWRSETGATSASGGHLASGGADDPLFDPLTAPLASERTREYPEPETSSYRPEPAEEPQGPRAPGARGRRRMISRRVRRTIKHVDPLSVLKLSLFYYAILLIVWLIVVAIVYSVLESAGVFELLEGLGQGLVIEQLRDLDITLGLVEKWAFFLGLLFVVVASLVNLFLAVLYNVAADLFGGLEVTFVERDH